MLEMRYQLTDVTALSLEIRDGREATQLSLLKLGLVLIRNLVVEKKSWRKDLIHFVLLLDIYALHHTVAECLSDPFKECHLESLT